MAGTALFMGCLNPASAEERPQTIPAVVAKVRPSVVTILTRGVPASPSQHAAPSGSGSGIIIDSGGYVLTNNHLVEGVKSVVVGLPTGRLTPGRVVARDFLLDLAIVKIVAPDLVPAELSQRLSLEIGETVIAIGNPLNPLASKGGSSVTAGVVSALGRAVLAPNGETLYDLIQTDAAINPGNSGGPLVDLSGQVVGINVVVDPSAQAISYAIPTEAVYPHIQSMILRGSVTRPDFGFTPVTVTPSLAASFGLEADRGVLALNVDPAKPAAVAGLQNGDVITALDQTQIFNMGDFWHSAMRDGDQAVLHLTVQGRGGQSTLKLPRPPVQKGIP
jgi:S1-C subfamily serine protease